MRLPTVLFDATAKSDLARTAAAQPGGEPCREASRAESVRGPGDGVTMARGAQRVHAEAAERLSSGAQSCCGSGVLARGHCRARGCCCGGGGAGRCGACGGGTQGPGRGSPPSSAQRAALRRCGTVARRRGALRTARRCLHRTGGAAGPARERRAGAAARAGPAACAGFSQAERPQPGLISPDLTMNCQILINPVKFE